MTVSTQAQLPGDNALVLLPEAATRNLNMVKLQGGTGSVCTAPAPNTTTQAREIVMPSHGIPLAIDAAIQDIARQLQAEPRPKPATKVVRRGVRRGARRLATDLPWLCVPSLYFMQCTVCGLVKIGVSGDYRLRRIELEKSTGHKLRVLGFDYGDMEIEATVLGYFSPSRVTGEWFRPSEAILEYAQRLRHRPDEPQP